MSVSIETAGPIFDGPHVGELLRASVLKGLLTALPGHEDRVDPDALNLVNAAAVAEDAGVSAAVTALPPSASGTYANLLRVTIVARGVHTVAAGSVIGAEPRVVQMGLWKVSAWEGKGGSGGERWGGDLLGVWSDADLRPRSPPAELPVIPRLCPRLVGCCWLGRDGSAPPRHAPTHVHEPGPARRRIAHSGCAGRGQHQHRVDGGRASGVC